MVAKTLRMKNRSSVRKMARNPLSIAVRPAVLSDARPHSDCTTWWSRPNLFSVGVEDRLVLGRYTLVAEGISRSAVVEGLCQFEELIEGTRVAFERLLPQPQQGGFLRRHPPRPSLFIEPDGNLERPFDIAAKIADAFLLAVRVPINFWTRMTGSMTSLSIAMPCMAGSSRSCVACHGRARWRPSRRWRNGGVRSRPIA